MFARGQGLFVCLLLLLFSSYLCVCLFWGSGYIYIDCASDKDWQGKRTDKVIFVLAKKIDEACTANSHCPYHGQCGDSGTGTCKCMTNYSPSSDKTTCNGEFGFPRVARVTSWVPLMLVEWLICVVHIMYPHAPST